MTENRRNPAVDAFMDKAKRREVLEKLRAILLDCQLDEDLKWGKPCYTHEGRNIALLHEFKDYAALLFFKGALLKDTAHILVQQTTNVQAARQVRFAEAREIDGKEALLRAYILEAIEAEKSGREIDFKETVAFSIPDEFRAKLAEDPALKTAFEGLTPGRQRGYILYFSEPKQAKTRVSRIEKCTPMILEGLGLHD
jgi:uncharacterized protein YdeI (YjbR/CyaY-like superfamily)